MEIEDNRLFSFYNGLCKRFNKSLALLYDDYTNRTLSKQFHYEKEDENGK